MRMRSEPTRIPTSHECLPALRADQTSVPRLAGTVRLPSCRRCVSTGASAIRPRRRSRSRTGSGAVGKAPVFVVQRHDASRLHYDFRLERNGALASWAVPKGVPLEPGTQHLAVHVEDHPLSYGDFEGEIPKGNYGAGTVEIWDRGTYELVEEKPNGGLTVHLHGEKLEGLWSLVPAKLSGDPKNWLLVRKREAGAGRSDTKSPAAAVRADARDARGRRADGRRLALRGEVGRLPRDRDDARRRGRAAQPERQLAERALSHGRAGARARAAHARLRARRRGGRDRQGRPRDLLRDAAGKRRHDVRLRRLRRARGRGRADRSACRCASAGSAWRG